jgi:hypothetical protein
MNTLQITLAALPQASKIPDYIPIPVFARPHKGTANTPANAGKKVAAFLQREGNRIKVLRASLKETKGRNK